LEEEKEVRGYSWKVYAVAALAALALFALAASTMFQKEDLQPGGATPLANPYSPGSKMECAYGESMGCNVSGCPGIKKCVGGSFGSCELPARACVPGKRIGCSLNGCSFGYKVCNSCGTSYSKCLSESEIENQAANCSSPGYGS
jgi:hypothetical protein